MDHKELQAIAQAAAKNIKTQDDLKEFPGVLGSDHPILLKF